MKSAIFKPNDIVPSIFQCITLFGRSYNNKRNNNITGGEVRIYMSRTFQSRSHLKSLSELVEGDPHCRKRGGNEGKMNKESVKENTVLEGNSSQQYSNWYLAGKIKANVMITKKEQRKKLHGLQTFVHGRYNTGKCNRK